MELTTLTHGVKSAEVYVFHACLHVLEGLSQCFNALLSMILYFYHVSMCRRVAIFNFLK